jgi:hypothetical protein
MLNFSTKGRFIRPFAVSGITQFKRVKKEALCNPRNEKAPTGGASSFKGISKGLASKLTSVW